MTPSEAFAAWIDGKRVEILRTGEWFPVAFFTLTQSGLNVTYNNSIQAVHAAAWGSEFRLADASAEPKPTVEDSEARSDTKNTLGRILDAWEKWYRIGSNTDSDGFERLQRAISDAQVVSWGIK